MPITTKAAILRQHGGSFTFECLAVPDPGPGQVLVRAMACGCCHSDESARSGAYPIPLPAVLGHEMAGVVEAIGPGVEELRPGDKVVAFSAGRCGSCKPCLEGISDLCENVETIRRRTSFSLEGAPVHAMTGLGGFAQLRTLDQRLLVKVRTDIEFAELALLGCALITGMGAVFNAAQVKAGESIAIIGCGGIGNAVIRGARLAGAGRIIAVDNNAGRRQSALAAGATDVLDPDQVDVLQATSELTQSRGVDAAFEAVGKAATMELAWRLTRRGGVFVPIGVGGSEPLALRPSEIVISGRRWHPAVMSSGSAPREILRLVDLIETGRLSITEMITDRLDFEQVNIGMANVVSGTGLRSVIMF